MTQTVEVARLRAEKEEVATVSLEDVLAQAHLDLRQKEEALRWESIQSVRDQVALENAFGEWKQANTAAVAIYAEVKAQRARLAVLEAA